MNINSVISSDCRYDDQSVLTQSVLIPSAQQVKRPRESFLDQIRAFISNFSIGRYHPKLYFNSSQSHHSSICGGLTTLLVFALFFILAFTNVKTLLSGNTLQITETKVIYSNWEHSEIKIGQMLDMGFKYP